MFVTNWISTTKIQKISEITNFFRHYFLSRTEVDLDLAEIQNHVLLKNASKNGITETIARFRAGKTGK